MMSDQEDFREDLHIGIMQENIFLGIHIWKQPLLQIVKRLGKGIMMIIIYIFYLFIYSFWRQNYFNRIILRIRIKVQIPFIS